MSEEKISCPSCGQHIWCDTAWAGRSINCPACQKPFTIPHLTGTDPAPPPMPALRRAPSAPPPPPPAQRPAVPAGAAGETSGLAIAALVLSLLPCLAIGGIICGHLARGQIRRNPRLQGNGLAVAGLIIGYVSVGLTLLLAGIGFLNGAMVGWKRAMARSQQIQNERSFPTPDFPPPPDETPVVPIPPGPISGTIKGQPFNYTQAHFEPVVGTLNIEQGQGFAVEQSLTIFLSNRGGEGFANREWKITPTKNFGNPSIHMRWKEKGAIRAGVLMNDYEMSIKTGPNEKGVITGTFLLKAAGTTPVDLKGNFTVPAASR